MARMEHGTSVMQDTEHNKAHARYMLLCTLLVGFGIEDQYLTGPWQTYKDAERAQIEETALQRDNGEFGYENRIVPIRNNETGTGEWK